MEMERFELLQEWSWRRLGDVADVMLGKTPKRAHYSSSGIKVVKFRDVSSRGITWTNDADGFVTDSSANDLRYLKQGDVLLTASAHDAKSIGKKTCIVTDLPDRFDRVAFVGELLCARADTKQILPGWIFGWFLSEQGGIAVSDKVEGVHLTSGRAQDIEIPVPPLAVQKRIVARVESLTSRSQQLRELNASLVDDMTRLLRAAYKRITEDAPTKPFSEVAKLVRRWVKTKPDQNYPETGIRSFGKGTFHKPSLTGEQLGNKRICRIKAGDLVFMNVFAWEGAIAVAQPEDDGRVASQRFMMHEVLPDQATAEFLCYYFLTERGLEQIRGASPGSAGRNRTLGITKLEKIPVPVPPIEDQRRFAKLRKLHFQLQRLHQEAEAELASFTPALLAKAFRGEL
jgi:restriction endonuclease S subunit